MEAGKNWKAELAKNLANEVKKGDLFFLPGTHTCPPYDFGTFLAETKAHAAALRKSGNWEDALSLELEYNLAMMAERDAQPERGKAYKRARNN